MSTHLRENYRVQEQLWPDYLDYLDEWDMDYSQYLHRTRKDYVYQVMCKYNQKMDCGDHTHLFTTEELQEGSNIGPLRIVSIPSLDTFINPSACWYLHLVKEDERLRDLDTNQSASRLSCPEALMIKKLTQLTLLRKGTTFEKLSFEQFRDEWWSKESLSAAQAIYQNSRTKPVSTPTEVLQELRQQLPAEPAPFLKHSNIADQPEIILPSSEVIRDHGFHMLLAARNDRFVILEIINGIRPYDFIDSNDLSKAIERCADCSSTATFNIGASPPIFIYSPPVTGRRIV